jgi:uncharacterized LabA/DUF88 family protein
MRVTVFIDGGFLKEKFRYYHQGRFPTAEDVLTIRDQVVDSEPLRNYDLFRVYYYDCEPYDGTIEHPVTKEVIDISDTPSARAQRHFLRTLRSKERMSVRIGELVYKGWKIDTRALQRMAEGDESFTGADLVPDLNQKQVDIKMGLDIAWMAQKRIVEAFALVAGDSDLVPALKFARSEGILTYLAPLGHSLRFDLIEHSDGLIETHI